MQREATILRREHGGGLSYVEDAEVEDVDDEVRDRPRWEVEEAICRCRVDLA